uniref:UDP-glucuronosyltransferase n=1 Tax=Steinernema glaseri TaxID=37863 RepID=A0A1I7Y2P2_9BILA
MGALADMLVDAGHDVTVLYNEMNPDVHIVGTKKAKTLSVPASEEVKAYFHGDGYISDTWTMVTANPLAQRSLNVAYGEAIAAQCVNLVKNHSGVLEQLRRERFDILLHEVMDYCQLGIMQAAGIKSHVFFQSAVFLDGVAEAVGISTNPSLIPSFFATAGEEMTLWERVVNSIQVYMSKEYSRIMYVIEERAFQEYMGDDFVPFQDLIDQATFVITNSDPFLDFPRPIISKVYDLGGMCVKEPKPLDRMWTDILAKRDTTVLIAFGSIVKSYTMPSNMKTALVDTFARFPDVTFIWKYETNDTLFLQGAQNVYAAPWIPQNDLLNHPSVKLFIMHGGMNSIHEAAHRGVPLVVVPQCADQMRNAKMIARLGNGVDFDRFDLNDADKISEVIRKVLNEKSYSKTAERVALMIKNRPINQTTSFLRLVEFAAKFGPVPSMTSLAPRTTLIAYFMLDAIALFFFTIICLGVILYYSVKSVFVYVSNRKRKIKEQ